MTNLFRQIPKIDTLANSKEFEGLNRALLLKIIKKEINALRKKIQDESIQDIDQSELIKRVKREYDDIANPSIKPLINATGITIHTNLGRSLISERIFDKTKEVFNSYTNLEFDLHTGKRGDRYDIAAKHLTLLFGCEDVLVVNNNAAAVFLILNTFAKDKEVIVSRGELVEIGGSFRIPEVMKSSGAKLKEVGTTNKTKLQDYKEAINEDTAMLMKVHKSNYTIEGFSQEVGIEELVKLSKERGLLDYYDLGSAYLPKLPYGLSDAEPSIFEILKHSPSLVSFSGDKLFGSVQAGIILGKKDLIKKLKKNQILRMFRVDKLTLSLLENTAIAYLKERYEDISTLKMILQDTKELKKRAQKIVKKTNLKTKPKESFTFVGGGTFPNRKIPTIVLEIDGDAMGLQKAFRDKRVIGRIENDKFLLDMRTLQDRDIEPLCNIINEIAQ
ncbi:MAG: L-seryl-tRNA(Sec) selenium transferase [Epsilonproteobacteria bacterium]|nr:L-seryl-tRNA(Sec) selenium transferase [Campylobacterota bacterium]